MKLVGRPAENDKFIQNFCNFDFSQNSNIRFGFPEKCLDMEKGHYSTSGEMPQINDVRIKFIKGLFQETLPIFLKKIKFESKDKTVLIHFDAPLHSATLFTLFKLSEKFTNYYFIFDQLGTEECCYQRCVNRQPESAQGL